MSRPFFSVIIPTYNRADFIGQTIKSVLNQDFENFELIVVDDGSTDNTAEVVDKISDNRIRYYKKENAERGAARNFGGKKAKGIYITFLDSDDLFYKNHLRVAYDYILENSEVYILFQQYEFLKDNGAVKLLFTPTQNPINQELVENGNFMSCHGVFVKKDTFLENQFNENWELSGSEDYELWLRLAARFPILYSSNVTSALVEHETRSVKSMNAYKLIKRKKLMLHYLRSDIPFMKKYGTLFHFIEANSYLYIALHLSILEKKSRLISLEFILKSVLKSIHVLKKRGFYFTIYKLIFS